VTGVRAMGRPTPAGPVVPWPGRLGVVAFLAVVWVMLWGSVGALTVLGGIVVGLLLTVAFPQPPTPLGLGRRAGRLSVALWHVAVDTVRSTLTVAWAAVRTGPATRSAVVTVQAPVCTSEVLVVAAILLSISPGTVVVEIDTARSELLVHVLPVHDLERTRRGLQTHVDRIVGALRAVGGGAR
jgi:multisubunit Na+/H+ antiporter MnhE subunit